MKTNLKTQIIATIGPSSANTEIIYQMIIHEMGIARLNFGWSNLEEHEKHLRMIRAAEEKAGRKIKIIFDLPGPRIQKVQGHTYDKNEKFLLTKNDEKYIESGVKNNIEYFALSFVGNKQDVIDCRNLIKKYNGNQLIISKIERQKGLDHLDEIIDVSDAIMIARGDLGNEVPIETIPFIQDEIIKKSKKAGKPVITATQMMLSMTKNIAPTRAEVTDVAYAVLQGSDAVMLSDETASGKYPIQTVEIMEKIIIETEKHMDYANLNLL
jgi:pyruvate kinase